MTKDCINSTGKEHKGIKVLLVIKKIKVGFDYFKFVSLFVN